MNAPSRFSPGELAVLAFTLAYSTAFSALILMRGNREFVIYVVTMLVLVGLVALTRKSAAYPVPMLWALSIWGLAHMAGGNLHVGGDVLYNLVLVPISGSGEMTILKYDQLVHAWGFGVTAWLLRHVLVRHHPSTARGLAGYALPALAAMGLGATNEIIEFIAVLSVPYTNVGGYLNTALDLVFNALGALLAMLACRIAADRHVAAS